MNLNFVFSFDMFTKMRRKVMVFCNQHKSFYSAAEFTSDQAKCNIFVPGALLEIADRLLIKGNFSQRAELEAVPFT